VVKELRPLAAQRDLTMRLHERALPLLADVDAFRIQQVLRNVLANAMRFAPPGSIIDIVCEDLARDGVEIAVRDHGPGIPVAELEAIFDAFVQSTRTRDGSGGTGLGLTICRKIMSAHGGTIRAGNAPDGGAVMWIRLPVSAATPEPELIVEPLPTVERVD
jgi:signal transduction histidine kinase